MNASAKDLAREAMLYDEIGHRREALQLLRAAGETAWSIGRISRRGPDQPQTIVT